MRSMQDVVAVVLAGGSGTRLWPLSYPGAPKQFLRLFGNRSLLQETIERVRSVVDRFVVVTAQALRLETMAQLRELGLGPDHFVVLAEPAPRNTAPAIALAAAYLRDNLGPQTRMAILPADHHISDAAGLCQCMTRALDAACGEVLVTIGIDPTAPETGYGYICAPGGDDVRVVQRFVEKPNAEQAARFLADGGYYWNSGMFFWRTDVFLAAVASHLPRLYTLATQPWVEFQARFIEAEAISVDYGILEKSRGVRMVPGAFGWSDVGTWDALAQHWRSQGRFAPGIQIEGSGNEIYSGRPTAVIGVDDLIVVDAPAGLLILKKGRAQHVGNAAKLAVETDPGAHASPPLPRVVPKPWGQELIWAETPNYVGKTLTIRQGESLSLQYHREKDETIHLLRGELLLRHGATPDQLEMLSMKPGDSYHIRPYTVHQMEAVTDCEVLEVSTPQLQDVVRLTDRYGREFT